jgi:D-glycero-D-manno-heptose 1,7-bisphosphate phosphatase
MSTEEASNGTARRELRAVFLDRDGILVEDAGLLTQASAIRILPGVPGALRRLKEAGFMLVVVSNQAVVARGLLDLAGMQALHRVVEELLRADGAPALDGFYFCPHHPNANLPEFRQDCLCRKPRPGLLLQAARELGLDLASSFMVGDRPTDLLAGARAGCRTVWARTGQHLAEPIQTTETFELPPRADWECDDLGGAAAWILNAAGDFG